MKQSSSRPIRYHGKGIPYLQDEDVKGRLIVIEGPDASGRSTHIGMITAKLEAAGHAVLNTGLRRSELVSEGIMDAKKGAYAWPQDHEPLLRGRLCRPA